jgi:hypothetical protein
MGKVYEEITPELAAWIDKQHLFFVGTAPLSQNGHVNVSPKGLDTLRILGQRRVAYLDLTGSGAETIAHVRENSRIVLMFCSFSDVPKIVRFHGEGTVITPTSEERTALLARFPTYIGARAIIDVKVTRISDSCGYGVRRTEQILFKWLNRKSQRRAYTWVSFAQALKWVGWPKTRIHRNLNPCRRAEVC